MAKIINIELPIYRTTINVLFGNIDSMKENMKDLNGLYEHLKENTSKYDLGRFVWDEEENYWCIWMPRIPKTIDEIATLVHEVEHCVFHLFKYKGMNHSEDSDEAYAYANDYLFREIMTKAKE